MLSLTDRIHRLLRQSERYTKTDMVYLTGSGGWLVLANAAFALIAFGVSVAFANFISKDAYGTYRFLLSILWALSAFSLTGLPTIVVRAVAQGHGKAYARAFRISILGSLPIFFIGLAISGYYFLQANSTLGWGVLLIALFGPALQAAYLYGAFFEGRKAFRENALFGFVLNLVPSLALITAMFAFPHALAFLGMYLAGTVVTGLAIGFYVYKKYQPEREGDEDIVKLSGHFSLMNFLGTIAQQIDKMLIFHLLGPVQLATYIFTTSIPDQLKIILSNIANIALPKFVNRSFAEVRANLWYRLLWLSLLLAAVVGAYVVAAPYIFHFFFPAYTEAVAYSQLFAVSLIFTGSILPVTLLEAHVAKKELYLYNLAYPAIQIVALVFFTVWWGLLGAVIARITARAFTLILSVLLVHTHKESGLPSA